MVTSSTSLIAGLLIGSAVLLGCARGQVSHDTLLPVGSAAPSALSAFDQNGTLHRLADCKGSVTVVYFYPKDATPGCTKEACAFRDVWDRYRAAGIKLFGVSADTQDSKAKFAAEHRLTFPLLADPDHKWIDAFHVPTTLGMASRVTFLLDRNLNVAKVYPDVDPGVHAGIVLADALALGNK